MSIESLEKWIASGAYEQVMMDAAEGDNDSIELVQDVDIWLRTICFHITQDRPDKAQKEAEGLAHFLALPWN